MRGLLPAVIAASAMAAGTTAHAGPPAVSHGLCAPHETVYFACETTRARWLGLCGDADGRALQYRFGRPGQLALRFPERAEDGARQLLHAHYFRAQVDRTEIRFERGGHDYVLFDYTEDGRRSAGVRVTTDQGKEVEMACRGPVESQLQKLATRLPCDRDSALNGGSCPAR